MLILWKCDFYAPLIVSHLDLKSCSNDEAQIRLINPLGLSHHHRGHVQVDPEKEVELVQVSVKGKQQLTPAYKAKNVSPG